MNQITENLQKIIQVKNITQKRLAQCSGLTESAISHYLKGDRIPRGVSLVRIAESLDVTVDELLGLNSQSNVPDKDEDLKEIKSLIARSGSKMSPQEKAELIAIIANSIK